MFNIRVDVVRLDADLGIDEVVWLNAVQISVL
jgi:hypothetical protein